MILTIPRSAFIVGDVVDNLTVVALLGTDAAGRIGIEWSNGVTSFAHEFPFEHGHGPDRAVVQSTMAQWYRVERASVAA